MSGSKRRPSRKWREVFWIVAAIALSFCLQWLAIEIIRSWAPVLILLNVWLMLWVGFSIATLDFSDKDRADFADFMSRHLG